MLCGAEAPSAADRSSATAAEPSTTSAHGATLDPSPSPRATTETATAAEPKSSSPSEPSPDTAATASAATASAASQAPAEAQSARDRGRAQGATGTKFAARGTVGPKRPSPAAQGSSGQAPADRAKTPTRKPVKVVRWVQLHSTSRALSLVLHWDTSRSHHPSLAAVLRSTACSALGTQMWCRLCIWQTVDEKQYTRVSTSETKHETTHVQYKTLDYLALYQKDLELTTLL